MNHLTLCRAVHDGLHGLIRVTAEEMKIIDHPLFQRLRWIRQTGLLTFVAPSAAHTRFEHSIGALAMAQKMLDALSRESRAASSKLYDLSEAQAGQAVRFHELDDKNQATLQRITRLCALVHDLGHGPLSHAFDPFAAKVSSVEETLKDPRLASLQTFRASLLETKTGRVHHEAVSCILFTALWHDIGGEPWMPEVVASVLLGKEVVYDFVPWEMRYWFPLIRDIVSSAPIDADRMDYLQRDSRAIGVTYGLYEQNRVLKSILCVRDLDANRPAFRLGWRKSGLRAIENFVSARFQMFVQIYHHKTLRAIELMLQAMTQEAASADLTLVDASSLDAFVNGYIHLSDEVFLRTLMGTIRPGFPGNERVRALANQIMRRKFWKRLYDFERHELFSVPLFLRMMEDEYHDRNFIVDRQSLKAMKDLEHGAYLLVLDEHGKYRCSPHDRSWLEASPIMRVLKEEELSLVRLFVETDEASSDQTRPLRERAIRLARELAPK